MANQSRELFSGPQSTMGVPDENQSVLGVNQSTPINQTTDINQSREFIGPLDNQSRLQEPTREPSSNYSGGTYGTPNQTLNPAESFDDSVKQIITSGQQSTPTATAPTAPTSTLDSGGIQFRSGLNQKQKDGILKLTEKPTESWSDTDKANWRYATNGSALPTAGGADITQEQVTQAQADMKAGETFTGETPVPEAPQAQSPTEGTISNTIPLGDEDALIARRNQLINQRFNTLAEQEIQAGLTNVEDLQRQTSELIIKGSDAIADITPEELRMLSPQQQSALRQMDRKGIEAQLAGVRTGLQFLGQERAHEAAVQARADAIAAEREKGINIGGQLVNPYTGEVMYEGVADSGPTTGDITEYQFARSQGYAGSFTQWKAAGGGSGGTGKLSATQYEAAGFGARISTANTTIDDLAEKFSGDLAFGGVLPNILQSDDRQVFEQASKNFINATLRRESGAAIADSEFENAYAQYIPRAGDGAGVLEQKKINREQILANMINEAGAAYTGSVGATPGQPGGQFIEPENAQQLFSNDLSTSQKGSAPEFIRKSPIDSRTGQDIECVIYSRMLAPGLPRMPYSDTNSDYNAAVKRGVINTHEPISNAVAIMPTIGFYGHVANVVSVNPDGSITIQEANYVDDQITRRTGTPEQLGIEGYWINKNN